MPFSCLPSPYQEDKASSSLQFSVFLLLLLQFSATPFSLKPPVFSPLFLTASISATGSSESIEKREDPDLHFSETCFFFDWISIQILFQFTAVATTRRSPPSVAGAFAEWGSSAADKTGVNSNDLSLGFNAGPSSTAWQAAGGRYGFPPEMGMFVVAPSTSYHHHDPSQISVGAADPPHAVNVGVIPFWQGQQLQQSWYSTKTGSLSFDQGGAAGSSQNSGSGGMTTCQDCGNQAKKDCSHRRCRTCCRSRGFDCSTHVKSTWVPASRRRERQMMALSGGAGGGASSGSTSGAKKARVISSTATTSRTSNSNTPPISYDTGSSHQDAGLKDSLPGQVRAAAVFKCVRVTAVDNGGGSDEYAYQAAVRIGGHVFKGFLYDQGAEAGEARGFPDISELHLGGSRSTSSPILDPSEVYGGSGGGILGGSGYGDTIS